MAGAGLILHPDKTRTVNMNLAESHYDSSAIGLKEAAGEG